MRVAFSDYEIDQERRELTYRGLPVPTTPQVFDILIYLLQNRERVVTKDELLQEVWQGRIVSESTVASHINAVRKAIGDSGSQQHLIRTIARKGFRFVGDTASTIARPLPEDEQAAETSPEVASATQDSDLVLPSKPSIAVLPFHNLSGDPGQEYFADGVVEDIITALSRLRWLFVIARNSSFTYKGRAVDAKAVGRELGVRYILEGSLRRAGDRVRITGQAIDTTSGTNVWADQFEGTLSDIFELQTRIAGSVVGAIAPQLERAEIERSKRKPPESLSAYDYYLRGVAKLHAGNRTAMEDAIPIFNQAIALDSDFAPAYGGLAWCYVWRKVNGWAVDPSGEALEGERLARLAVSLGRDDAVVLTRAGHAIGHLAKDIEAGIALIDRALLLNPNYAPAWFLGAFLRIFHGEPEDAMRRLSHAVRLSPLDPEMFRMETGMALAHFFARRFDEAADSAERSLANLPSMLVGTAIKAASYALAGRTHQSTDAMLRLRGLSPSMRLSGLSEWLPLHRKQDLDLLTEGLRLAGLPR